MYVLVGVCKRGHMCKGVCVHAQEGEARGASVQEEVGV